MKIKIKKTVKLFFNIVQIMLITILLAYVFTLIFYSNKTVKIWGFEFSIVQSSSMSPRIKIYDFIVMVNATKNLKENDIVVFFDDAKNNKIIHRVVNVVKEDNAYKFITKGDNNEFADAGVRTMSDIYGKYLITIPFLGYIISFLTTTLGLVSLLLNFSVLLLIMLLWTLEKPGLDFGVFK